MTLTAPGRQPALTEQPRPAAETLLDTRTGAVAIGTRAHGIPVRVPLWHDGTAVPLSITGDPGTGAERILRNLWAAEHACGLTRSLAAGDDLDPDEPHLDRCATTAQETRELLAAVAEVARARRSAAVRFRPNGETPLLTLTLTGWSPFDAATVALAAEVARTGPAAGISLRIVHRRHVRAAYGSDALFAAMSRGTRIVLRSTQPDIDLGDGPTTIPERDAGTGFLSTPRNRRARSPFCTWRADTPRSAEVT
ncbi:hypothetical protein AB0C76_32995 [Kitasatospora sp. NPDC048722]|uniref:hypothetical protein n=1 Tax=Kitasatospora sp. NPDC048722 TaxID=3155639 RepID=UPI0033ED36AA